jgi:nucleoside-diphosphate-sugar epimerase
MTVAIVGAGWLGSAVAQALTEPVVATTRSGAWPHAVVPSHVTVAALDVTAPDLDIAALARATKLVMAFAPGRTQDRAALYVEGTRRLLEARTDGGAKLQRVVYVGSTSALPDVDGWVDESCTTWPTTERGRVQRRAEAVVQTLCDAAGIPWLVLRMGGLYGPGRELERIYRQRSDAPLPGDGMAATNLVHRDDAVAAVMAGLQAPADLTGVVHVVDDDHAPRRQMYTAIARAHGVAPAAWAEPASADAPAGGKRVRNDRLREVLNVRLRHPTHSGGTAATRRT